VPHRELINNPALPPALQRAMCMQCTFSWIPVDEWPTRLPHLDRFLTADELGLLRRASTRPLDPPLTPEEYERLLQLGGWGQDLALHDNPACPPAVVVRLVDEQGMGWWHGNLPRAYVARGLASPELRVRQHLASNPSLLPEDCRRLAADPEVRNSVAPHPALPADCIDALLRDPTFDRQWLARNPSLSPGAQLLVAADPSVEARRELLHNMSLTAEARSLVGTLPPEDFS
jgi:hypothetical protein